MSGGTTTGKPESVLDMIIAAVAASVPPGRAMPETQIDVAERDACELAARVRVFLQGVAGQSTAITYQALAKAMRLPPPQTIHQLSNALEQLMKEDAAAHRPFIAALVISKRRNGLPAPGFFDCAAALDRFDGDAAFADAAAFHAQEFKAAVAYWPLCG